MARNIEIKAKLINPARLVAVAATLTPTPPTRLSQVDTFFKFPGARLKLRLETGAHPEFIYYKRADQKGPKQSSYARIPAPFPNLLRRVLAVFFPVYAQVHKERLLYLVGQTRIHIDHVRGLGDYVELEVVLRPDQAQEEGTRIAMELMEQLAIKRAQLVDVSYVDLVRSLSLKPDGTAQLPHEFKTTT